MEKTASFEAGVVAGLEKTAILATGMGAMSADEGHRWGGAGRGFLYGIPLGVGGAMAGGAIGGAHGAQAGNIAGRVAAGIIGGHHASGKNWKGEKIKKSKK